MGVAREEEIPGRGMEKRNGRFFVRQEKGSGWTKRQEEVETPLQVAVTYNSPASPEVGIETGRMIESDGGIPSIAGKAPSCPVPVSDPENPGIDVTFFDPYEFRGKEGSDLLVGDPVQNMFKRMDGGFFLGDVKMEIDVDGVDPSGGFGIRECLKDIRIGEVGAFPVVSQDIFVGIAVVELNVGTHFPVVRKDKEVGRGFGVELGVASVHVQDGIGPDFPEGVACGAPVSAPLVEHDPLPGRQEVFVHPVEGSSDLLFQVEAVSGDMNMDRPFRFLCSCWNPVERMAEGMASSFDVRKGENLPCQVHAPSGSLVPWIDLACDDGNREWQAVPDEDFMI